MSCKVDTAVTELVEEMVSGAIENAIGDLDLSDKVEEAAGEIDFSERVEEAVGELDITAKVEEALDYSIDLADKVRDAIDIEDEVRTAIGNEELISDEAAQDHIRDAVMELTSFNARAFAFVSDAAGVDAMGSRGAELLDFQKVRELFKVTRRILKAAEGATVSSLMTPALDELQRLVDFDAWQAKQIAEPETKETEEAQG